MTLSRRKTLALIGGGMVVAASGASAAFLTTRTPQAAIVPWQMAGQYDDVRLNALSYALLAPNPHNRQPWLVELEGADALRLYRDKSRRLPETDPFDRQITIGLGCFLELMVIAASAAGQAVDLTLYPDGPDGPVAHARFNAGAEPDPLAAHILTRRTCNEAFEDRAVPRNMADQLAAFADIHTDSATVEALRQLTSEAWMVEALTERTYRESVDLMRFGKAEINANPDGIALGGALLESLMLVGMLDRDSLLDQSSTAFRQSNEAILGILRATPAYAVLTSPDNTRDDQIRAGRRWVRLNLATTGLGLSLHPVSQALQEYPEMAEHYVIAHRMLAGEGETVQMLGRVGYGPTLAQKPRWPLEARMQHA